MISRNKTKIIIAFSIFVFLFLNAVGLWYEQHYTLQGTVVDTTNNIISIEDNRGNVWEWENTETDKEEQLEVADSVVLIMSNNATLDNIYDDTIVKITLIE